MKQQLAKAAPLHMYLLYLYIYIIRRARTDAPLRWPEASPPNPPPPPPALQYPTSASAGAARRRRRRRSPSDPPGRPAACRFRHVTSRGVSPHVPSPRRCPPPARGSSRRLPCHVPPSYPSSRPSVTSPLSRLTVAHCYHVLSLRPLVTPSVTSLRHVLSSRPCVTFRRHISRHRRHRQVPRRGTRGTGATPRRRP